MKTLATVGIVSTLVATVLFIIMSVVAFIAGDAASIASVVYFSAVLYLVAKYNDIRE